MVLSKGFICVFSIWSSLGIVFICDASLKLSATNPIVPEENITLSCTSDKKLKTGAVVKWTRNNTTVIDVTVKNNITRVKVLDRLYGYGCDKQTNRKFCLTIPTSNVTEKEHGSNWQCYIAAGPVSNVFWLNIPVPVESVILTALKRDTEVPYIKAGEKVVFICTTGPSRPPVKEQGIRWFRDNQELIGQSNITTIQVDDDKFITTARMVMHGKEGDKESDIKCSARNMDVRTPIVSNSIRMVVFWEPSSRATITGYTTGYRLNEDMALTLNCSVKGGKPLAVLNWFSTCSKYNATNKSSSNLSVSEIVITVTRSYNGKDCTCIATHPLKSYRSSQSVTFTVNYPPLLHVEIQNTTENLSDVTVRCLGDGEPSNLTITFWSQTIAGTIVRTTTDFEHVSEDRAVITLRNVNIEDTGLYTCKATNGIPDRNNVQEQSGSSYLDVKVSAKYPSDPDKLKFYGTLGKRLSIKVPFYSNPQAINYQVSWFNKTCNINSSSSLSVPCWSRNITFSLVDGVNITLRVFGKLVTLQGQAAEINISTFSKYHRGNYCITINNYENLVSNTSVVINPTGPPETPKLFTFLSITSHTIVLNWKKGFNGGHTQTFVVNFTETESIKNTVESRETLELDRKSDYYLTVNNLKPGTTYNITLNAYNHAGSSSFQSILASTKKEAAVSTAVILGVVASVSLALIVSFIAGAILLKRPLARNTGNNGDLLKVRHALSQDNDPDDGMKPNIIYESAGPYFAAQSNNSEGNGDFGYIAEVSASDNEQNAIYAVVNKARKPKKNSSASGCAEPDQSYENLKGDVNNMGEKSDAGFKENKPSRKKNKDGLDYTEVVLKDTNSDQSRRVIHGIENKNDYADIDFSKHADPMPSDDE